MPEDNSDSRLKVEPIPASRPGANCYMVQPNSFFTFNPHEPPGNDVDNIGITYLGRLGTGQGDDCNIHHVGLVWQTDPELIRAIYHLKTNGEVRIQTGEMQGNALMRLTIQTRIFYGAGYLGDGLCVGWRRRED